MAKVDPKTRYKVMSSIRSTGNRSTELRLRAFMACSGLTGWQVRRGDVLGRPDFVFPAERVAIFADGCFWHSCPVCHIKTPGNRRYWVPKLRRVRERDTKVTATLRRAGWSVLRVWEHDIRDRPEAVIKQIKSKLNRRRPT